MKRWGWIGAGLVGAVVAMLLAVELDAASSWRLPVAGNPGTGDLVYGRDRNNLTSLASVATGRVLVSGGAGSAPAWSTSLPSGFTQGGTLRPVSVISDATIAVGAANCGTVYIATRSSATQTFTLPTASTVPGCQVTFIAGHADGEILINAAADAQGFVFTTFAAVGADADTAIVTEADGSPGIKNTAGTNAIGDNCTFVSDGVLTWFGVGICPGIWAAQ